MSRFSSRSDASELMDDLSIEGPELERTLDELTMINRLLGGYTPSLDGIDRLLPEGTREFTVLDVGTGAADTPRRIVEHAQRQGRVARITGIDLAPTTIAYARQHCAAYPTIRIEQQDLFTLPEDQQFDVVHAALVLHHFSGDAAARALARMHRLSRHGVVVNDLHRHWAAWCGIRLATAALSRNRLIRHDGPLSVLRAFSRANLVSLANAAGLPAPEIRWRPMFRWEMLVRSTAR